MVALLADGERQPPNVGVFGARSGRSSPWPLNSATQ